MEEGAGQLLTQLLLFLNYPACLQAAADLGPIDVALPGEPGEEIGNAFENADKALQRYLNGTKDTSALAKKDSTSDSTSSVLNQNALLRVSSGDRGLV